MKKSIFLTIAVFLVFGISGMSAQKSCCDKGTVNPPCEKNEKAYTSEKGEVETSFKVSGNCGMCEARIEKAALSVKGVKTAEWDKTTKILKVTFIKGTDKKDIEKTIAAVGHDTPDFKAKNEVYNALPDCCKYER